MRLLTSFPHGSIPLDDDRAERVHDCEVGVGRSNDCVEPALGAVGDSSGTGLGPSAKVGIGLHYHDLPARELEWLRVDAGKAELEYATGAVAKQLEDPRRRGCGESGRKPVHRYARYMNTKLTGKFLGVAYDWRRPTWERYKSRWWNTKDRRLVMPRAFGWGYDFNVAEAARRLHLRR